MKTGAEMEGLQLELRKPEPPGAEEAGSVCPTSPGTGCGPGAQ